MFLSFESKGQSHNDLKSILSNPEYEKYQKAEKLISKGMLIVEPMGSGEMKKSRSKQAQREANLKKEQAYIILKDGYNKKLNLYSSYLDRYLVDNKRLSESNSHEINEIQSLIENNKSKSQKLYSKSHNTSKLTNTIKLQEEAQKLQLDAIASAEEGLVRIQSFKAAPEKKQEKVVEHQMVTEAEPEKPVEAVVPVAVVAVAETQKEKVEEKPPKSIETVDVYFTIQIMADKVPVNVTRQRMVYKGNRKVMENRGDSWYRYSVGKFSSYTEAAAAMKSEGIKGYVVAYNGSERISTSEAKKILGGVK